MMEETRCITVTFPEDLLNELDILAPPRKRNQIIVQATAVFVRRLKLLAAIKETSGAWDGASHAELATADDIERWMRQTRGTWRREAS